MSKRIILVHKGSSYKTAYDELTGFALACQSHFPDFEVVLTMTSTRAINKLSHRGVEIKPLATLLFDASYEITIIQPLYLFEGIEYSALTELIERYYQSSRILVNGPLIYFEDDVEQLVKALSKAQDNKPTLYVGHGTLHEVNSIYRKIEIALNALSPQKIYVRTLLEAGDLICQQLISDGVKRVSLKPLMLTSGYHVSKDLIGEDSLVTMLKKAELEVMASSNGLLSDVEIRQLFIRKIEKCILSEVF